MSGTNGGDTNHTPDPAAENRGSPNDAPGAPSATPGPVEASGQTPGHQAPPGSEQLTTEETRAEAAEAGEPAVSGNGADRLHGCPVTDSLGATVVHCNRDDYLGLCRALKADGYVMPIGLTGVDYLTHPGRVLPDGVRAERFEVVVELLDLVRHRRIRVRCQVPVSDPSLPSLYDLWPGTDFHERETYDMFGIRFEGHPDLSRILMPEDWEGHPLRKDYDTGHVPVQFKEAPRGATI